MWASLVPFSHRYHREPLIGWSTARLSQIDARDTARSEVRSLGVDVQKISNFGSRTLAPPARAPVLAPSPAHPHNVGKGEWHGVVRSRGGLAQRIHAGSGRASEAGDGSPCLLWLFLYALSGGSGPVGLVGHSGRSHRIRRGASRIAGRVSPPDVGAL